MSAPGRIHTGFGPAPVTRPIPRSAGPRHRAGGGPAAGRPSYRAVAPTVHHAQARPVHPQAPAPRQHGYAVEPVTQPIPRVAVPRSAAEGGTPRGSMLMQQLGGPAGMVASTVPTLVFVVLQAAFDAALPVAVGVSTGVALALAVWRYFRGAALRPALSGVFGVLACALAVYVTGEAKDFYLLGIIGSGLGFAAFLVSVLVRKPLVGVIWHAMAGRLPRWWTVPAVRRAFDIASLTWVAVLGSRVLVQGLLYASPSAEEWLGWVRLAMGLPLTAVAAAVTVWAIRRAGRG